jgi:hypothetical protein
VSGGADTLYMKFLSVPGAPALKSKGQFLNIALFTQLKTLIEKKSSTKIIRKGLFLRLKESHLAQLSL